MKNKTQELPQEVFAVLISVRKEGGHDYYYFTGFRGGMIYLRLDQADLPECPSQSMAILVKSLRMLMLLLLVNVGAFDIQ